MILRYTVTMDDIVEFNVVHHLQSRTLRRNTAKTVLLRYAFFIGIMLLLMPTPQIFRTRFFWVGMGVATLFSVVPNLFYRSTIRRNTRKMYQEGQNLGVIGDHQLQINAKELIETTQVEESRRSWRSVEKIIETDELVLIYFAAIMACVIPKESISYGDLDQFLAAARQYFHDAHPEIELEQRV